MIRGIEWDNLRYTVNKQGPFIVFCNGKCDGFNKDLTFYIYNISFQNPKLSILEVDWEKQRGFGPTEHDKIMNTVLLYYRGQVVKELNYPDKDKTINIFQKAIDFYNLNIENTARIIVQENRRKFNFAPIPGHIDLCSMENHFGFSCMNSILNQKIKLNKIENLTQLNSQNCSETQTDENIVLDKEPEFPLIVVKSDIKNEHMSFSKPVDNKLEIYSSKEEDINQKFVNNLTKKVFDQMKYINQIHNNMISESVQKPPKCKNNLSDNCLMDQSKINKNKRIKVLKKVNPKNRGLNKIMFASQRKSSRTISKPVFIRKFKKFNSTKIESCPRKDK